MHNLSVCCIAVYTSVNDVMTGDNNGVANLIPIGAEAESPISHPRPTRALRLSGTEA